MIYPVVIYLLLLAATATSFPKPNDFFPRRYAPNTQSQFIPSPVFKRQSGYDTKTPEIDSGPLPQSSGGGYDVKTPGPGQDSGPLPQSSGGGYDVKTPGPGQDSGPLPQSSGGGYDMKTPGPGQDSGPIPQSSGSGYDTKTPGLDSGSTSPKTGGGYEYPTPSSKLENDGTSASGSSGSGSIVAPGKYESSSNSGSGAGSVKCNRVGQGDTYRFVCEVSRKEDITLKYTHVLWLAGASASAPPVEIIVPNYRVEEIIKAGFKSAGPGGKQAIKILLQRPENTVAAEVESPKAGKVEPEVNVQYQPATDTLVHYPNDQAYRASSGPILPPARS